MYCLISQTLRPSFSSPPLIPAHNLYYVKVSEAAGGAAVWDAINGVKASNYTILGTTTSATMVTSEKIDNFQFLLFNAANGWGDNFNMMPPAIFKASSAEWELETFSGNDSGQVKFSYTSETETSTTIAVSAHRTGLRLRVTGVNRIT